MTELEKEVGILKIKLEDAKFALGAARYRAEQAEKNLDFMREENVRLRDRVTELEVRIERLQRGDA